MKANKDESKLRSRIDPVYLPLKAYLFSLGEKKFSLPQYGLHLPAFDMRAMEAKMDLADTKAAERGIPSHEFKEPISVGALERYSVALLNLGPIVSIEKSEWEQFIANGTVPTSTDIATKRYTHWLKNALFMVQSAIAQGALLAGEPLLTSLYDNLQNFTTRATDCDADSKNTFECAVKKNYVLTGNLLRYVVLKRVIAGGRGSAYSQALAAKDTLALQNMLGPEFKDRIVLDEEGLIKMNWNEKLAHYYSDLPTAEEASQGIILYSDNMARLIRLQSKIADALLEVSPTLIGTSAANDLLKVIAVINR